MPSLEKNLEDANQLFFKKRFREASLMYNKVLSIDPKHIVALNNKGYSLSKLKDHVNTISCYDIALQILPDDKTLLINKISSLRKMKEYEKARSIVI